MDVWPNHPVRFQIGSTLTRVELSSGLIGRLDINTDASRIMGDESFGQTAKQL